MKISVLSTRGLTLMAGLMIFASCQQDEIVTPLDNVSIEERGTSTTALPSVVLYGISGSNELYTYVSGPPATMTANVMIIGLNEGERMLAIDVRPATGKLYGVSNKNILYTIDVATGKATAVSNIPFTPGITGNMVGFDFDPRTDRIRLVTGNDQNLRIHPATGAVTNIDLSINPSMPSINSIAYAYGSTSTGLSMLYDVDAIEGKLYRQNSNTGTLSPVGSMGLSITGDGGFDISRNNIAFGVYLSSSTGTSLSSDSDDLSEVSYRLYNIDLRSGSTKSMGQVKAMIGLAIKL